MSQLQPLSKDLVPFLDPFLPESSKETTRRPFVTLTYAASLDSRIAAQPGTQTLISHPQTKIMTHYLRSKHSAILVGVGTFNADDPGLNCRYGSEPSHQIRPVILDPHFRCTLTEDSRIVRTARAGENLAPWVVVDESVFSSCHSPGPRDAANHADSQAKKNLIESIGGKILVLPLQELKVDSSSLLFWTTIFVELKLQGINSIMVEGGAAVINSLLECSSLIDSLVVTVGPVYLGSQGVQVSPSREVRFQTVQWWTGITDSVMAAKFLV